ncbi:AfsR/SARP family transcriptional regulator [Streptosporangium canum]|uniref:AfsR/SARP family transcriptional regulator n=1 Tax=Streptosporangium canum TaxID=324952 RepID=UPI0036BB4FCB
MRIALLGPVRAYARDGASIDIGGARLRMLPARLALDAGSAVPAGSLIDGLWGADPPADAAKRTCASRWPRSWASIRRPTCGRPTWPYCAANSTGRRCDRSPYRATSRHL